MRTQEQINLVINTFDFKKVQKVLEFLQIKWSFKNETARIPSVEEVTKVGENCLKKLSEIEDNSALVSVGGFEAEKIEGTFELRFVLERANPLAQLLG
jgi:hypothetical protein